MTRQRYDWRANLQLLADEGRPYQRPDGSTAFKPITKKALAEKLGVSARTLRRWLNEGGAPSPEHEAVIQKKGANRRRSMKRAGYPDIERVPYGHRRVLKRWRYVNGKPVWDGETYLSEWINFHVGGWSKEEIFRLVKSLQGYRNFVQFIYKINLGEDKGKHQHGATFRYDIDSYDDVDILEEIGKILFQYQSNGESGQNEIIWVGAMANPHPVF